MTILVTGSTGTIGAELVRSLAARPDVTIRAAVHSTAAAQSRRLNNIVQVDFDYDNVATMRAAVEGADAVFLLTPFVPIRLSSRSVLWTPRKPSMSNIS